MKFKKITCNDAGNILVALLVQVGAAEAVTLHSTATDLQEAQRAPGEAVVLEQKLTNQEQLWNFQDSTLAMYQLYFAKK